MPIFILTMEVSNGFTDSCTGHITIEYESGEALICDLMNAAIEAAKKGELAFEFLNREFYYDDFLSVREITQGKNKGKMKFKLYNPNIIPLEDWLFQNTLWQDPSQKPVVYMKHKLVELIFALEEGFTIERDIVDTLVPVAENPSQEIKKIVSTQGIKLEIRDGQRFFRLTGYRSAIDPANTPLLEMIYDPAKWRIGEKIVHA